MGQFLGDYILSNWLGLIFSIFIGFLPALVLVKKDPNNLVQNHTTINETIEKITIIIKQTEIKEKEQDNNFIIFFFIAVAIATVLFIRHYNLILDIYASIIIVIITATLALAIKLYRNNQYDHLIRFWTLMLLLITVFNLFSLSLMSQLDLAKTDATSFSTIFNSVGMSGIKDYINRTIGFIIALMLNILSIILLINIISVNKISLRKNFFYKWFVKHTLSYTKPGFLVFIVLIFSTLSLSLTSGLLMEMIDNINNYF